MNDWFLLIDKNSFLGVIPITEVKELCLETFTQPLNVILSAFIASTLPTTPTQHNPSTGALGSRLPLGTRTPSEEVDNSYPTPTRNMC